jgi:hypothetical protein
MSANEVTGVGSRESGIEDLHNTPNAGSETPALPRSERLALIVIAVVTAAMRVVAFFHYRFDSDEPQHLHVAWGWTAGLL